MSEIGLRLNIRNSEVGCEITFFYIFYSVFHERLVMLNYAWLMIYREIQNMIFFF